MPELVFIVAPFDPSAETKTGQKIEPPGGRYCNMESQECRDYGKFTAVDTDGYVCLNCGGRISKWAPFAEVVKTMCAEEK